MKFSSGTTRNSGDWKYSTVEGRHTLTAVNGGVKRRIGMVLAVLATGSATVSEIKDLLSKKNKSLSCSDIRYALKRLIDANVVTSTGSRQDTTYSVNAKGLTLWSKTIKEMV